MSALPRGLRIVRGYVQVRLIHQGTYYHKNFGPDCTLAREMALEHLVMKRKEIREHKFGIVKELPSMKFPEAAKVYFDKWSKERTPEGNLKHPDPYECGRVIETSLVPYFGKFDFDAIKPKNVVQWREQRLKTVQGTSVNREQTVLSSIFSHIDQWMRTEEIEAFKLPKDPQTGHVYNPCDSVEKAETKKRARVISRYEISKLKLAARELKDENARDMISLAVKTCLSLKDLKTLRFGDQIDLDRSKTDVHVIIPITVMFHPNWKNWRKRWEAIVTKSGVENIEFRDLRKAGINLAYGLGHDMRWVSQYAGHAEQRTTETMYTKVNIEKMKEIATDIDKLVESL